MAALSVVAQVDAIVGMSVPSVLVKSKGAPAQISTALLPFLFVRNVKLAQASRTLTYGSGDLPQMACEICVIVEAVRQGNQADTYTTVRKIMDELYAAIELNAAILRLDDYNIYETFESGQDSIYFAVVAELRMS